MSPAEAALAQDYSPIETPIEDVASLPNEVSTEGSQADRAAEAAEQRKADKLAAERAKETKLSPREALEAAQAKVEKESAAEAKKAKATPKVTAEADDEAAEADADEPAKKGREKDEKGRFKPAKADADTDTETDGPAVDDAAKAKPGQRAPADINVAPARFSPDAKEAWAAAPESVRGEVHRAFRNMESGLEEHARRWAPIKEYDDLARASNTTLPAALKEYVGIDRMLGENFMGGIQRIFQNKGVDLREFAAHVLGQPVDKVEQANSKAFRDLQAHNAQLEQRLARIETKGQSAEMNAIMSTIDEFKKDKPLFDELSDDILVHIQNNGLSLDDAYDRAYDDAQSKAQRLGFNTRAKARDADPDPSSDQLRSGRRSINGAPSAGSSPATSKPSPTIRESLRRASLRARG
jgi:hypothetical protein